MPVPVPALVPASELELVLESELEPEPVMVPRALGPVTRQLQAPGLVPAMSWLQVPATRCW